jgi:hypothetical protein
LQNPVGFIRSQASRQAFLASSLAEEVSSVAFTRQLNSPPNTQQLSSQTRQDDALQEGPQRAGPCLQEGHNCQGKLSSSYIQFEQHDLQGSDQLVPRKISDGVAFSPDSTPGAPA